MVVIAVYLGKYIHICLLFDYYHHHNEIKRIIWYKYLVLSYYVVEISGAYDNEETAAHAYDLAALKYWGQETIINFPVLLKILKHFY